MGNSNDDTKYKSIWSKLDVILKPARAEYAVRGYPTYWFLKSEATRIAPLSGYQESNRLKDILFYIKNDLSDKMKYDEYMEKGGREGKF